MIIIISPFVIIVVLVVAVLAAHITAGYLVAMLTILGVSLIATAGLVAYITARMNPAHNKRADPFEREPIDYATYQRQLEAEPVPELEPRVIHQHLHLDGLQPEQVAEYLRMIRRDDA